MLWTDLTLGFPHWNHTTTCTFICFRTSTQGNARIHLLPVEQLCQKMELSSHALEFPFHAIARYTNAHSHSHALNKITVRSPFSKEFPLHSHHCALTQICTFNLNAHVSIRGANGNDDARVCMYMFVCVCLYVNTSIRRIFIVFSVKSPQQKQIKHSHYTHTRPSTTHSVACWEFEPKATNTDKWNYQFWARIFKLVCVGMTTATQ